MEFSIQCMQHGIAHRVMVSVADERHLVSQMLTTSMTCSALYCLLNPLALPEIKTEFEETDSRQDRLL
jgi:hypothetical protein